MDTFITTSSQRSTITKFMVILTEENTLQSLLPHHFDYSKAQSLTTKHISHTQQIMKLNKILTHKVENLGFRVKTRA